MSKTIPAEPIGHVPSNGYCRAAWQVVCRSSAVIEFDTAGIITWANDRFTMLMGYSLAQLVGHHHRMLCDPEYAASPECERFWAVLRAGEFEQGEFSHWHANGL